MKVEGRCVEKKGSRGCGREKKRREWGANVIKIHYINIGTAKE